MGYRGYGQWGTGTYSRAFTSASSAIFDFDASCHSVAFASAQETIEMKGDLRISDRATNAPITVVWEIIVAFSFSS